MGEADRLAQRLSRLHGRDQLWLTFPVQAVGHQETLVLIVNEDSQWNVVDDRLHELEGLLGLGFRQLQLKRAVLELRDVGDDEHQHAVVEAAGFDHAPASVGELFDRFVRSAVGLRAMNDFLIDLTGRLARQFAVAPIQAGREAQADKGLKRYSCFDFFRQPGKHGAQRGVAEDERACFVEDQHGRADGVQAGVENGVQLRALAAGALEFLHHLQHVADVAAAATIAEKSAIIAKPGKTAGDHPERGILRRLDLVGKIPEGLPLLQQPGVILIDMGGIVALAEQFRARFADQAAGLKAGDFIQIVRDDRESMIGVRLPDPVEIAGHEFAVVVDRGRIRQVDVRPIFRVFRHAQPCAEFLAPDAGNPP